MTQKEMLNFMKENQRDALSSERHQYNRARKDMNEWLGKENVPEDVKATMYAQELQKVNRLKEQVSRPQPLQVQMVPQTETTPQQLPQTETPETMSTVEQQIIDSVPKTMQGRAKLLLRSIKQRPEVIDWNENGQLIFEGTTVPQSNIVDLVNDVLRKRKGFEPQHSKTFVKGLAKINIPEDYVRNPDRLETMRTYRRIQDYPPATPLAAPPKTPVRKRTAPQQKGSGLKFGKWLRAPR